MDGELVSGSSSETNGEETFDVSSPYAYSRLFEQEEPAYLALGMTHDDYWHGSPGLARIYRKADEIRRERMNSQLWLQGMYIYEALCDASPLFRSFGKGKVTAHPYSKEPYDIFGKKEKKEKQEARKQKAERATMDKGLAFMHKFMAAFNQAHQGGEDKCQ